MTQAKRPLSPHLQVYKWRIHMMTSIMHRATSVALAAGTILLVWWLCAIATSESSFDSLQALLGHWAGRVVLFGITFAAMQHMASGVRHLLMDTGALLELGANRMSAILTYVFAAVSTLVIWACAYGMLGGLV